eukprot:5588713-Alexandrium_andersonii.AAC.1
MLLETRRVGCSMLLRSKCPCVAHVRIAAKVLLQCACVCLTVCLSALVGVCVGSSANVPGSMSMWLRLRLAHCLCVWRARARGFLSALASVCASVSDSLSVSVAVGMRV